MIFGRSLPSSNITYMTASRCPACVDTRDDMLTDIRHELYLDQKGALHHALQAILRLILIQCPSQV